MFSFVPSVCLASRGRKMHYKTVFIMLSCKLPASWKSCMNLHVVHLETEVWNEWTHLRWGSKLVLQMRVFEITFKKIWQGYEQKSDLSLLRDFKIPSPLSCIAGLPWQLTVTERTRTQHTWVIVSLLRNYNSVQFPVLPSKVEVETPPSLLALHPIPCPCDYILQLVIISLVQPPRNNKPSLPSCTKELTHIATEQT